jgi:hypothetical protein
VRLDAGLDEREEILFELEPADVAVDVHRELRSIVTSDGRNAHRSIAPRAVQSAA